VIETAFYPMPSMLYVKLKSEVRHKGPGRRAREVVAPS
jgi:hypothetical protein